MGFGSIHHPHQLTFTLEPNAQYFFPSIYFAVLLVVPILFSNARVANLKHESNYITHLLKAFCGIPWALRNNPSFLAGYTKTPSLAHSLVQLVLTLPTLKCLTTVLALSTREMEMTLFRVFVSSVLSPHLAFLLLTSSN